MKRNLLNEEELTIKLDLPNLDLGDESLEGAQATIVQDEEESPEGGDEELDLEEPGEEPSEDLGGETEEEPEDEGLLENDDTVVEIDEGMLRREIAFMKLLRESGESVPNVDGEAPGSDEFDDFGGAEEEGEALDLDLSEGWDLDESDALADEGTHEEGHTATAAHMPKDEEKHAGSEHGPDSAASEDDGDDDEEGDLLELDLDEMHGMSQAEDSRKYGGKGGDDVEQSQLVSRGTNESVRSRMAKELKLQESLRNRASQLKKLYESYKTAASRSKTLLERKEATSRVGELKSTYAATAEQYNSSVTRFNKLSQSLSEGTVKNSTRSNSAAKPVASAGSDTLRKKLAETNLFNAKLLFTNKVLQTESLTARQKAQVIEQLDGAETIREAKLIYESLAKALVKPRKTVTEGRVLGSSSQATRAASTQTQPLNEGIEAERWARLAGIK